MVFRSFLVFVFAVSAVWAQSGENDVELLLANVQAQVPVVLGNVAKTASDLDSQLKFSTDSVNSISGQIDKLASEHQKAKASGDTSAISSITNQLQSAAKVQADVLNKAQSAFSATIKEQNDNINSGSADKAQAQPLIDRAFQNFGVILAEAKAQVAKISKKEQDLGIKLEKPNVNAE